MIEAVLADYVPTADDLDLTTQYMVNGTLLPCWLWPSTPNCIPASTTPPTSMCRSPAPSSATSPESLMRRTGRVTTWPASGELLFRSQTARARLLVERVAALAVAAGVRAAEAIDAERA